MPPGLYGLGRIGALELGDIVAAKVPADSERLAIRRRYLPDKVPLLKRVAAVGGDRVCATGKRLLVNDRTVAVRKERDAKGRPLPRWHGCLVLGKGDVLLLGDGPWSFDGRYFGVSRKDRLIGRARPLWTW